MQFFFCTVCKIFLPNKENGIILFFSFIQEFTENGQIFRKIFYYKKRYYKQRSAAAVLPRRYHLSFATPTASKIYTI